jgi:hypothetical protein
MIHLRCRVQVQLAGGDIAAIWAPDIERCPGEKVVVNLLGRAAVFEDESDSILTAWC